ncbi:hypothetical protein AB6Q13_09325 [Ralstonia solanacearum]|uniref:hypothetical protein n=1 Tax=Ralstonia solanacearum TaxID=305 RepID=UPI0009BBD763|nr:hypothetical protein [Ralstonia solanacearum]MBB6591715.1 hypothetical protein [Ralstonia solanacearum]MBB6595938.1 hypothetical protein [Ralstonia solanacearum]
MKPPVSRPAFCLKELQAKRHPVDADVFEALSPYLRDHINRLGSYLPDLQRKVPPLDPKIDFDFAFKSAASVNFGENFANPGRPSYSTWLRTRHSAGRAAPADR